VAAVLEELGWIRLDWCFQWLMAEGREHCVQSKKVESSGVDVEQRDVFRSRI